MSTFLPIALLVLSVLCLGAALLTWRAGGKHQVFSASILTAITTGAVLPDGSKGQIAALIVAGSLIFVSLMTTPRARLRRMRAELTLAAAAIATICAMELFDPPRPIAMAGLVLVGVFVVAALGVSLVRAARENQKPRA